MLIEAALGRYDLRTFPPWPCVRCGKHSLRIKSDTFASEEVLGSRQARRNPDWGPDWQEDRFVCLVICGQPQCEEVYSVSGTIHYQETDPVAGTVDMSLEPRFVDPAPYLIRLPSKCPKKVVAEMEQAFGVFWWSPGSCLNRMRVALEYLLDAKGIRRKRRDGKGSLRNLSLHERLEELGKRHTSVDKKMLAVKWVSNAGSHRGDVGRSEAIEALELLEYVFDEVLEQRHERLTRMANVINKQKGRRRKPPF